MKTNNSELLNLHCSSDFGRNMCLDFWEKSSQSKICNFGMKSIIEKYICTFDVYVYNANIGFPMQICKSSSLPTIMFKWFS